MSNSLPTIDLFNPLRYWADEPLDMPVLDARDAELDREDSLSERYAFMLGENLGTHRLGLSENCQNEAMERGYAHGFSSSARHAGVYLRKLLTLRSNAFRRGIPVSSALTTEYLQEITVTVCPVSGVALTQGTLHDSDWSIDRLDNELGYVPGNVCFVSTRVNTLKGSMAFKPAIDAAASLLEEHEEHGYSMDIGNGLVAIEAWRIAALMAGPAGYAIGKFGLFPPMAMAPCVWASFQSMVAGLHTSCARTRLEGAHQRKREKLFKHLGKDMWRTSSKLVDAIATCLRRGIHPCDIWLVPENSMPLAELSNALMSSPPPSAMALSDETVSLSIKGFSPVSQFARNR